MEYRINQRTGDKISVIGIGSSYLSETPEKEAFETHRKDMIYQIHFGADYASGEYGWTTSVEQIKRSIDWQLTKLRTDYIDYGFIHCLDKESDWNAYRKDGVLEHLLKMKEEGLVRHIGLSSHTPSLANTAIDTGLVDMLMFSINPCYDYQKGDYAIGSSDERMSLYRRCEKEGIGISVMKAFSGGQLLDERTSPFGKALTEYQCLQYALDKPGVLTVLPGLRDRKDLEKLLGFFEASDEEKDYSVIGTLVPKEAEGSCVYCNHCHPCPAGLDIALINKYYDLAKAGDSMAIGHYQKLEKNASDCIRCGHCNRRCPFHVDQMSRMQEIEAYFQTA